MMKQCANIAVTFFTNLKALSIFPSLAPAFHLHLWVMPEKMTLRSRYCGWRWCWPSFIAARRLMLKKSPTSFLQQWMRRTTEDYPRKNWWKKGSKLFHLIPIGVSTPIINNEMKRNYKNNWVTLNQRPFILTHTLNTEPCVELYFVNLTGNINGKWTVNI